MKLKKLWLYILTPLLVLFGSATLANAVQAKELTKVITNVSIWEVDNSKFLQSDSKGVYNLSPQKHSYANYKFATDFDLSQYDGNLNDGDTFTLTVPAPLTVKAESFELKDKETNTAVGDVKVVSDGENKGGKVTITLKNLQDYLAKKGGAQVQGVKGTFYVAFSSKKELEEQTINFNKSETKNEISQKVRFKNAAAIDYSDGIGKTNFNKFSGTISKEKWDSPLLGKKGDYLHNWNVRVNPKQAAYDKLEIHDWADSDFSPMQFIPETLTVTAGWFDKTYTLQDKTVLQAGTDYQIKWNESYTDFTITILNAKSITKNGKPAAYLIHYDSTAPGDGTKVQNNVEVKGNDKVLTTRDDQQDTIAKQVGNSTVASGGTIQLETGYRITLYKVDEKTQDRLKGAKFKITPPDGATVSEKITETDDNGIAQSPVFSEEDVKKGEFTITEVEAPKGYQLDSTPIKVTVGKEGVIKTISNKRNSTKAQIQAIKKLTGRAMKAGEFEFDLFDDKTNKVVETVTNDAEGNISFAELTFDKAGTYNYHIVEKKANTTEKGVTYDANPVGVTVTVTADAEGKLSAAVAYENDDKTFENTYAVEKTSAPIEVTKALSGRTLKADEFEFVLKNDADGSEVQKVKNTADGKVAFSPIEYTVASTYKYTIVETNAGQTIDGVTYDSLEVKVTVEVTDDGEGKLTANVTYPADKEFNNSYGASKTPATLAVKKTLTGRELKADEFEFTLTDQDGNVKETVKNDKDGNVKFSVLEFDKAGTFTYKIAEKAGTATGITYDTKTITATVTVADNGKGALEATVSYDDEKAFENTYTPAGATSVTLGAKKVLEGKDLEAGKYSFELKKEDGTVVETVTNAADSTVAFSPISYDESQVGTHKYTISEVAGTETGITYDKTVQEVEVTVEKVSATELKATASKEAKDLVFTNKYTPAKTAVPVKKVWNDANNQDGKRPSSITVKLLADGQDTGETLTLNEANGWAGSFTNLDADKGGTPIKYTVVEVTVTGYTSDVTGDAASGFTITNSYSPETVDVKATKNWDDANNQDGKRPESVTVQLYKSVDGSKPAAVESKKLTLTAKDKTDDNTWVASFTNLPQYKAGKEITYSIEEVDVPAGYEASVTGQVVTNTHTPDTVILSGTKVWNDNNNQSGKRADKVTVQILNGDKVVQEIEVSEKTGWKFESKALPKYENGKLIEYKVKEVAVKEYTSTVTTDKDGKYTVTNEYTPVKTSVKGKKIWKGDEKHKDARPSSITVKLLADGQDTGKTAIASEASGWTYEFTGLERYKDTKDTEIKYSVEEVPVTGYSSEVEGLNITNTYIPETSTPGKPNDPGKPGPKPQLPNTGEKASNAAVVVGLALMAVTGGLYFVSRKNK